MSCWPHFLTHEVWIYPLHSPWLGRYISSHLSHITCLIEIYNLSKHIRWYAQIVKQLSLDRDPLMVWPMSRAPGHHFTPIVILYLGVRLNRFTMMLVPHGTTVLLVDFRFFRNSFLAGNSENQKIQNTFFWFVFQFWGKLALARTISRSISWFVLSLGVRIPLFRFSQKRSKKRKSTGSTV